MYHEFACTYVYLAPVMQNTNGTVKNIIGVFVIYKVAKWRIIKTDL